MNARRVREARLTLGARLLALALLACACRDYDPPSDHYGMFASCCDGLGVCIAHGLVAEEQRDRLGRDSCARSLVCAPAELVQGAPAPRSCTALATGAEGRCLPYCLPEIAAQPGLRRDDCPDGNLCAPCYDPFSGEASGACELAQDTGPSQPKRTFDSCCGELGRCLPSALVDEAARAALARDECADSQELCVPVALARDQSWTPQACRDAANGGEGRCLPACLPEVARRAKQLSQADCPSEHLCAPCFDPLTGDSTDACKLGADPGPRDPPSVFASCCGALGRCVPLQLVAADDRDKLGRDNCERSEDLCAPELLARDSEAQFDACVVAATRAEGRCLPACLPALAERNAMLARESCSQGDVCAPCFDPVTGENTGACNLGGDTGPKQAPKLFARCCGELGRCVPSQLLPEREREQLDRESCSRAADSCVPEPLLLDPEHVFATCAASGTSAEGRCLPACLPGVATRADQLAQQDCETDHLCAPCFDPLDGSDTGACQLAGDPGPHDPALSYAHCCSDAGRCIPRAQVPEDLRNQLSASDCITTDGELCVPLSLAREPSAPPTRCHDSATGAEGRCLLACLPAVATRAGQLRGSGCDQAELCVPCFDPITGDTTGACRSVASDPGPSEPPVVFSDCCSGEGVCVPSSLLPGGSSNLSPQGCTGNGLVCAPRLLVTDANASLASCLSLFGPSVCVNSCFVPEGLGDVLQSSECAAEERCLPCWAASGVCR